MTTTPTDATRSKLKAALAPEVRISVPQAVRGFSVVDCVSEGIDTWWHKSTVGHAMQAVSPLVEPHLKPFVRRHYQGVLLGSAAAGALISQFPGRSARTVFKVAGPVLISSIVLEIAKAGLRQMRNQPPPATSTQ